MAAVAARQSAPARTTASSSARCSAATPPPAPGRGTAWVCSLPATTTLACQPPSISDTLPMSGPAGLSWRTVLARRDGYRQAYHDFDIERVAAMTDAELSGLLTDSPLIRNRLKIFSTRDNARAAVEAIAQHGSLDRYLWSFVNHAPIRNRRTDHSQVPATTPASDAMSKALKKAGFRFVGSTICYAFMQATGMVDDHLTICFRHTQE